MCRWLVGTLFIFSSFTKGVDPLGTQYKILDYLAAYGMEWMNEAALYMAVTMIMIEFIVGFCLITNTLPRLATLGATLLMLFFTLTTFFDAMYDLVPDCGCFGAAVKMTNWQTFFKNLIIDSILIPLIFNNKHLKYKKSSMVWQWFLTLLFVFLFIGFEIYNIRHLPVIDFTDWKVGKDISPKEGAQPADIYLKFENVETGEIKEYLSPDYPWNDSVWMSQWKFVSQHQVGGTESLGFSILDEDGNDDTHMLYDVEKLFVFVAPYFEEFSDEDFKICEHIVDYSYKNSFNYLWITSANPEYVSQLQDKYTFIDEVYYGDELELKTMVRSNPGLMLINNGLIIDKWSKIDFPSDEQIDKYNLGE